MGSTQHTELCHWSNDSEACHTLPCLFDCVFDRLQLNPTVKLLYVTPEQLVKSK